MSWARTAARKAAREGGGYSSPHGDLPIRAAPALVAAGADEHDISMLGAILRRASPVGRDQARGARPTESTSWSSRYELGSILGKTVRTVARRLARLLEHVPQLFRRQRYERTQLLPDGKSRALWGPVGVNFVDVALLEQMAGASTSSPRRPADNVTPPATADEKSPPPDASDDLRDLIGIWEERAPAESNAETKQRAAKIKRLLELGERRQSIDDAILAFTDRAVGGNVYDYVHELAVPLSAFVRKDGSVSESFARLVAAGAKGRKSREAHAAADAREELAQAARRKALDAAHRKQPPNEFDAMIPAHVRAQMDAERDRGPP